MHGVMVCKPRPLGMTVLANRCDNPRRIQTFDSLVKVGGKQLESFLKLPL